MPVAIESSPNGSTTDTLLGFLGRVVDTAGEVANASLTRPQPPAAPTDAPKIPEPAPAAPPPPAEAPPRAFGDNRWPLILGGVALAVAAGVFLAMRK